MTKEQRDTILKLTKYNYSLLGCQFPQDNTEDLIDYLYESIHNDEKRCLLSAINAHNIYNNDDMTEYDFFDWHGL